MKKFKFALGAFDWLIDAFADVIWWVRQTLMRGKPETQGTQSFSRLRREDVLFIETPVNAADLFEARAAFALVAHRLLPLDMENAVIAFSSSGPQCWRVAVTRKSTLELARSTGKRGLKLGVSDPEGRLFVFRDEPERRALRQLALRWIGAGALTAIAILLLPASVTHWSERSLQSLQDQRSQIAADIHSLQGLSEAQSDFGASGDVEINAVIGMFNRVNAALSQEVKVRDAQITQRELSFQLVAPTRQHLDQTALSLSEVRGVVLINQRFLGIQDQDAIMAVTLRLEQDA